MRRRSKPGREPVKARRRKTVTLKRRYAPKAVRSSSDATHETEVARLTRELNEALEQQTATSEVLQLISGSPVDLRPVFDTVLASATRLCKAKFANLLLSESGGSRVVATFNAPRAFAELRQREPVIRAPRWTRDPVTGVVHVADCAEEPAYKQGDPVAVALVEVAGARTLLAVPMVKDKARIGTLAIYRQEVRPFSEKQIELVKNFAAQAVIAIENAQLLNELRQRTTDLTERTADLTEALEQQTATSEVLQVISSSPGELDPVFTAMLANATRICEAQFGNFMLREGRTFRAVAWHGEPTYVENLQREPLIVLSDDTRTPLARLIETTEPVHVADLRSEPAYKASGFAPLATLIDRGGARTLLVVPMLKENILVGAISIHRQEVRPFSDKQIELVQNFANQAVIAIENTRLLNELRQRTTDLAEALDQQTATSEVLQVVSSSPGDLQPVFTTMLEKAVHICDAKFGYIYRWDGEAFDLFATYNVPPAFAARRGLRICPKPGMPFDRMLATKTTVHVADLAAEPIYTEERDPAIVAAVELGGVRTLLAVPMLKESELIGAFAIYRQEARPFTDKQIALVSNFAAQAVIAIENTRLLNELRESLQQQTATADVLKVISRSTFNLQTVLDTLVESAARLCEADTVVIGRPKGEALYFEAWYGYSPEYAEYGASHPAEIDRGSLSGRVLLERKIIHIVDVLADPEYTYKGKEILGFRRTLLGVPLLREGSPIGVIGLGRNSVRPFTEKQIELVTTFADQAVIAIENVRLFEAEQQRTRELTESLEQQTATSEVLQVISSSPGDLEPVFATMLERAVRICGAKFGSIHRWDGQGLQLVATHNLPGAFAEARSRIPFVRPGPDNLFGRMVTTKTVIHVADLAAEEAYIKGAAPTVAAVEQGGVRTMLFVPMLKEDEIVGAFTLYRQEVRPFTDKQVALVKNFAAQAVIAVENTRLLNELRQRTDDLSERTRELTDRWSNRQRRRRCSR